MSRPAPRHPWAPRAGSRIPTCLYLRRSRARRAMVGWRTEAGQIPERGPDLRLGGGPQGAVRCLVPGPGGDTGRFLETSLMSCHSAPRAAGNRGCSSCRWPGCWLGEERRGAQRGGPQTEEAPRASTGLGTGGPRVPLGAQLGIPRMWPSLGRRGRDKLHSSGPGPGETGTQGPWHLPSALARWAALPSERQSRGAENKSAFEPGSSEGRAVPAASNHTHTTESMAGGGGSLSSHEIKTESGAGVGCQRCPQALLWAFINWDNEFEKETSISH